MLHTPVYKKINGKPLLSPSELFREEHLCQKEGLHGMRLYNYSYFEACKFWSFVRHEFYGGGGGGGGGAGK